MSWLRPKTGLQISPSRKLSACHTHVRLAKFNRQGMVTSSWNFPEQTAQEMGRRKKCRPLQIYVSNRLCMSEFENFGWVRKVRDTGCLSGCIFANPTVLLGALFSFQSTSLKSFPWSPIDVSVLSYFFRNKRT